MAFTFEADCFSALEPTLREQRGGEALTQRKGLETSTHAPRKPGRCDRAGPLPRLRAAPSAAARGAHGPLCSFACRRKVWPCVSSRIAELEAPLVCLRNAASVTEVVPRWPTSYLAAVGLRGVGGGCRQGAAVPHPVRFPAPRQERASACF